MLIADDEPDVRSLLRVWLDTAGFQTEVADDGREALAVLEGDGIDVLLLDIMMPVLDGWMVLEAMRERSDSTPVIVLSAHCTNADRARAFRLGAVAFVDKPFEPEDLATLIEELAAASPEELKVRRGSGLAAMESQ